MCCACLVAMQMREEEEDKKKNPSFLPLLCSIIHTSAVVTNGSFSRVQGDCWDRRTRQADSRIKNIQACDYRKSEYFVSWRLGRGRRGSIKTHLPQIPPPPDDQSETALRCCVFFRDLEKGGEWAEVTQSRHTHVR